MRFCPFCTAENADESSVCDTCGRRLPPLPPRRAKTGPPTGITLPSRSKPASNPPPARSGNTMPPPMPERSVRPSQPPPVSPAPADHAALRNAIAPGPAAQRREVPPDDARDPVHARRASDRDKPPSNPPPIPGSGPRKSPTMPPPMPSRPASGVGFDDDFNTNIAATPYNERDDSLTNVSAAPYDGPTNPGGSAFDPGLGGATVPSAPAYVDPPARPPTQPPPTPGSGSRPLPPPPTRPSSSTKPPPLGAPAPMAPTAAPAGVSGGRAMPDAQSRSGARLPAGVGPGMSSGPRFGPDAAPMPPSQPKPAAPQTAASPFMPPAGPSPFAASPGRAALPPPSGAMPAARDAMRTPTGVGPPPTRIQRPDSDRPFTPPKVDPIPEIPEPGLITASRYTIQFAKARFQRRGAIKTLGADIKQDTEALDQVLGALGREARSAKVDGRVFSAENQAITSAEERAFMLGQESGDVDGRKVEESSKFMDIEKERNAKLSEAQRSVDETQKELAHLEGQRRGLRDKRKELERRQKAYLKAAEDAERQAGNSQMGEARQDLRRSAEDHRKEAAALEPERQDIDRRLGSLERPFNEATARLDAGKAELDAAKRSLADAREGHTHRLAELDAEQKRKQREIGLAEAEIARRLVTLGTLVNLNRIEDAQFRELYERIDRLRGAITARTTEIEKLTAEREAYDRGTLVRGIAAMGGALVAFIALIVILRAIL